MSSFVTFTGVVYPNQCDAMGHMNVQYYVAAFDQAFWHLVAALGYSTSWVTDKQQGWADVHHALDYQTELRAGELFMVESSPAQIARTSLVTHHRLCRRGDGAVCASMAMTSVYFDLSARKALSIPDTIRDAVVRYPMSRMVVFSEGGSKDAR